MIETEWFLSWSVTLKPEYLQSHKVKFCPVQIQILISVDSDIHSPNYKKEATQLSKYTS